MAGQPKTRARKAIAAAISAGIDLQNASITDIASAQPLPTATSYARARGKPTASPLPIAANPAAYQPGPAIRSTADNLQADQLSHFAAALRPGIALSIERIKPPWCAGWLEEYSPENGTIGELFEYISSEYGGQSYRLTVRHLDGRPLYETKLQIAGKPRERGKPIDRDAWEGNARAAASPATPTTAAAAAPDTQLVLKMLDLAQANADRVLEAVEKIGQANSGQIARLIDTIVESRENTANRQGFLGSLKEVVDASEALSQVKGLLGSDAPTAGAPPDEDALKMVSREFLRNVAASTAQGFLAKRKPPPNGKHPTPSAPPSPTMAARRQAATPPPATPAIDEIPAAMSLSTRGGKND
jgi:hypothetical protein